MPKATTSDWSFCWRSEQALSELEIAAIVTVAGYVMHLLRTWVRVRGRVQVERLRGTVRRDVVRTLPAGSRIVEKPEGTTTIEVGPSYRGREKRAERVGE
ncbi:hypothetical protein GCM10010433_32530 [Streptomyces pulveraceus]